MSVSTSGYGICSAAMNAKQPGLRVWQDRLADLAPLVPAAISAIDSILPGDVVRIR